MFILGYLKEIIIAIIGFISFYLYSKNKKLEVNNKKLETDKEVLEHNIANKDKVIDVHNKIMEKDATFEASDIYGSIDRLSKKRNDKK
jgi:type II secretory ATPase GspE/PulE/Tfp pilus assembly ATPase PilB-like protein